jgi:Resolvase, N terminal domain
MTFETIRTMLVGYARVSTSEQTLDLQKDALEKIGCTKIFSDVVSGAKAERKGLLEALEYVREGDTLVVWRLDRLGRSLRHLIETITKLNNRKIGFSRWREIRACNGNACGESKGQNVHDSLLDPTFLIVATNPKAPIY